MYKFIPNEQARGDVVKKNSMRQYKEPHLFERNCFSF